MAYLERAANDNGHHAVGRMALRIFADFVPTLRKPGSLDVPNDSRQQQSEARGEFALGPSGYAKACSAAMAFTLKAKAERTRGFCPHCLAEASYHRMLWNQPWAVLCPTHGVWLVQACGGCGRRYCAADSWRRACRCGSRWASAAAEPVPPPVVLIARHLMGPDADEVLSAQSSASVDWPRYFTTNPELVRARVSAALRVLTLEHVGRRKLESMSMLPDAVRAMWVGAAEALVHWPRNYFDSVRARLQLGVIHHWLGVAPVISHQAEDELRRWVAEAGLPAFIRQALEQLHSVHAIPPSWREWFSMRVPMGGTVKRVMYAYYLSTHQAKSALDLSVKEFHWLVKRRLLPARNLQAHDANAAIPRYLVDDARRFLSAAVSASRTARWLGCNRPMIDTLVAERVLVPQIPSQPPAMWRFRIDDLDALHGALEAVVAPRPRRSEAEPVVSLLRLWQWARASGSKGAVGTILDLARRGVIDLYAVRSARGTLSRLVVPARDLPRIADAITDLRVLQLKAVARMRSEYQRDRRSLGESILKRCVARDGRRNARRTIESSPAEGHPLCICAPLPERWL